MDNNDVLHLVTQRRQPYGSVRRCCEMCGQMAGPYSFGDQLNWTDEEEEWRDAGNNCLSVRRISEGSETQLHAKSD